MMKLRNITGQLVQIRTHRRAWLAARSLLCLTGQVIKANFRRRVCVFGRLCEIINARSDRPTGQSVAEQHHKNSAKLPRQFIVWSMSLHHYVHTTGGKLNSSKGECERWQLQENCNDDRRSRSNLGFNAQCTRRNVFDWNRYVLS